MSKIYTYGIIKDTNTPQLYLDEFWDNDFHFIDLKNIDWYVANKAKIDSEYFKFTYTQTNKEKLYVYKENNREDFHQDKYGEHWSISGIYALKKSDFDNDLEKAYSFAQAEMNYLNELKHSHFNEVYFRAYEYNQETQKYVETNNFINEKLIQAHDLEEITQEKDLTLKEKLIKIVRNKNTLDYDKLDEFDFLQDANSIVMSEKALLELPQELHSFIDKGLCEREKQFEQEPEKEPLNSKIFIEDLKQLNELFHKETKFFIKEKPLNPQDYWVVEFNEAFPEGGVKDYRGKVITKELIDEIKNLDERVCKSNPVWAKEEEDGKITLVEIPYFKFYFNHIKNREVIDYYKLTIGDGNEVNEYEFQYLYELTNNEHITENNQQDEEPEQENEQHVQKRAKRLRM